MLSVSVGGCSHVQRQCRRMSSSVFCQCDVLAHVEPPAMCRCTVSLQPCALSTVLLRCCSYYHVMFAASSKSDVPCISQAPSWRHGAKGLPQRQRAVQEPPAWAAAAHARHAPLDGGASREAGRCLRGVRRARQRERARSRAAPLPRHHPGGCRLRTAGSEAARGPRQRCWQDRKKRRSPSPQPAPGLAGPPAGAGATGREHRSAFLANVPQP